MSEQEEKPGLVDRLKNVFFEPAPPKEAPPDEVVSAEAEAPSTVPAPTIDTAGAADFDAAYARIAGAADPKTDQVLAAFVDMSRKGLSGPPLAAAMTSMISAFGADATVIAATIAERRQAIAASVESQRGAMQSRVAELGSRSAAIVAAAEEEIGELEGRIKDLRGQVADAQVTVQKANASEQTTFAAFERQAALKDEGLNAFAEFLAGVTTAS
jgi:hypothetical protein